MLAERLDETKYLYGASVIIGMFPNGPLAVLTLRSLIVEGIMTLTDPGLRDLYDLKVFVVCRPATQTPSVIGQW